MHNLDRVLSQQEAFGETEYLGNEFEAYADEYSDELEFESDGDFEFEAEGEFEFEFDENELAAELLTVSSDEELEQFFGKLFKKVARGARNFAKSSVGKAIGGALKQAAKSALPSVGAALGSFIPIPGVGTAIGGMAGKALAKALELETAGMSGEDSEFEVAKGIVRMAASAAKTATRAPANANPKAVANHAIKNALQVARAAGVRPGSAGRRPATGRWVRRGRNIIILGA